MAAAFRPVNSPLASGSGSATSTAARGDIITPSPSLRSAATPRPSTAPTAPHLENNMDDSTTPTRSTFSPHMQSQQSMSSSVAASGIPDSATTRAGTADRLQHTASHQRDSMEMDVDDDGSLPATDEGPLSDEESENGDGTRSGKKKKSQRFYCTSYPPCNLSFTRSEHLARHIRKHTGERPFQCHCTRRFSRLDNLRQHAQTVHVNEDIPIDSLAATGSRFQRHVRTERGRQAGNRARASTGGSAGGPPRGHSKSLSTSSINSVSSVGSSNYSTATDPRRRPPPLVMADPRTRPVDPYRANDNPFAYRPPSPSEFSTPTSATFSTGQNSPRWTGMSSPNVGHSRSQSMYAPDSRAHVRRLSVPSAAPMYQQMPGRPVFGGSGPANSSNVGTFSPASSNFVASPTVSNASGWTGRRDSTSSNGEEAWRRRTWHPDSRGYNPNGGSYLSTVTNSSSINPEPRPPIANPHAGPQSGLQLPGIESFDQAQTPLTPPGRRTSPMVVDQHPRPPTLQSTPRDLVAPEDRRNLNVYDASQHRGLPRHDVASHTPPRDTSGAWAYDASKAIQQVQMDSRGPPARYETHPPPVSYSIGGPAGGQGYHQQTMSAPSVSSSRATKRRAWYNGPLEPHKEEPRMPQDPRSTHADRIVHPNFTGFSGFPSREQPQQAQIQSPPPQQQQQQQREGPASGGESLRGLEALVAAATGEGSTATAY